MREYWGAQNANTPFLNAHQPLNHISNAAQVAHALQDAYDFYEWITARGSIGDPTNIVPNDPRNPWDNELKALFQLDVNQLNECSTCNTGFLSQEGYGIIDAKFDDNTHTDLDFIVGDWFINGEGMQHCPTCTTVEDFVYNRKIDAAPQVLRIKVNLYKQTAGRLIKQALPFDVPDRLVLTQHQENAWLPLEYTLSSAIAHAGLGGADDIRFDMLTPAVSSNGSIGFNPVGDEEEPGNEQGQNDDQDMEDDQEFNINDIEAELEADMVDSWQQFVTNLLFNQQQANEAEQEVHVLPANQVVDYQQFEGVTVAGIDDIDFDAQNEMDWNQPSYLDAAGNILPHLMDNDEEVEEVLDLYPLPEANRVDRPSSYRGEPRAMQDPGGWPRRSESPRRRPNSPPRHTMVNFNGLVEVTREEFVRELGPGSSQPASEVDDDEFYGNQDPLFRRGSASTDHNSSPSEADSQATITAPPSDEASSDEASLGEAFFGESSSDEASSDEVSSDEASSEESRGFWVADWHTGPGLQQHLANSHPPRAPVLAQGPFQLNVLNNANGNNNNNDASPSPSNSPPAQPNNNNNSNIIDLGSPSESSEDNNINNNNANIVDLGSPSPSSSEDNNINNDNANIIDLGSPPPSSEDDDGDHWIVNTRGPANSSHISNEHFQTLGANQSLNDNPQVPPATDPCHREDGYQVYILTYTRNKLRGQHRKKEMMIPAFV